MVCAVWFWVGFGFLEEAGGGGLVACVLVWFFVLFSAQMNY